MTVSVVVVNWNAGEQLNECIESVQTYAGNQLDSIVIVDNGSTDGSADAFDTARNLSIIRAGKNLGFGKACNLGATKNRSEFLLFLNPDAKLFPGTLPAALSFMSQPENAHIGICGVQLVDNSGHVARSCTRFPTVSAFVAGSLGIDRRFPKAGHFMTEWDHAETRLVDHVIGAFFLIRRELFEEVGGFDERFFVYLEDLDFSLRASKAGWKTVFLAEAKAFHAGGGTSQQVKARRLFYATRSKILYSFKHFNAIGANVVLFAVVVLELPARTVLGLARGSIATVLETWSAYGMLFRWLPRWWTKGITR